MASMFEKGLHDKRSMQRHMPEVMFGLNKKWMVHAGVNFSNMHQKALIWEAARVYAKWRFLSFDDVHRHFRMAAFGAAVYSRNDLNHNEINLMQGDQSGVQAGLIATQLWNKLAVSATGSWNEVMHQKRSKKIYDQIYVFHALNYSLSAGYLLLPFTYKSYNQTNMNLYLELLGSKNINFPSERYYVDLAPSMQFIFNSTSKLNLGYRFQLSGDMYRMADKSFMVSYEYIFLNALKKKRKGM